MSQIDQNVLDGFTAQLDAHKQALNEYIQANLMLKTQLNMDQKLFQDLNKKLEDANKRIAELISIEAPKENDDAA